MIDGKDFAVIHEKRLKYTNTILELWKENKCLESSLKKACRLERVVNT